MVEVHVVDAFTDRPFCGNPAAVCLLPHPAPEAWMQSVAAEMRHSETAFVWPEGVSWRLRWFTPTREVDLCGHATLASAHVLWQTGRLARSARASFQTRSGLLTCEGTSQGIAMDFPANPASLVEAPPGLWKALGVSASRTKDATHVLRNRMDYLLALAPDDAAVLAARPRFQALAALAGLHGFVLTAPSSDPAFDYVCRYFVPAFGVDEDPATGSIQTMLGPFWAKRLGKSVLRCHQLSARRGIMTVEPVGERVRITGQARTVWSGRLSKEAAAPEWLTA